MKRIICFALTLFFVFLGYAQAIKLAGTTWNEDVFIKSWTFNQNGTITMKQSGDLSRRLGGVYCTVEIAQTRIGTKWKLNGNKLECEDIPLQISLNVKLKNAFSFSAAQKQRINAAIPALKQQVINDERQKWQSKVGNKYFYAIKSYSPKEFWLQYGGYSYNERWLHRDVENMTATQKAAYNKLVAEFEAEKAKREAEEAKRKAEEKAKREAEEAKRKVEEKAKREAEEMAIKKSLVDGYVNLGLPSGTLWAACNIGAAKPEDFGDYFAWGETKGYKSVKTTFNWNTYKWCKGSEKTMTKYCCNGGYGYEDFIDKLTELEPEDDAAKVNLGSIWRIPSKEQFEELFNNSYTTTEWTTLNGVKGHKITSKTNGNIIFLPAAGYRDDSSFYDAGSGGYYWSRTLCTSDPYYARYLYFNSGGISTNNGSRYYGRSVRPVRNTNE